MVRDEREITPIRKSKRFRAADEHKLLAAPHHVRKYSVAKWILTAKDRYQKYTCRTPGCSKKIRIYCSCSIGHWMRQECFVKHRVEVSREDEDLEPN
jgi:hypothetical protein